jgi:hypothetical protein
LARALAVVLVLPPLVLVGDRPQPQTGNRLLGDLATRRQKRPLWLRGRGEPEGRGAAVRTEPLQEASTPWWAVLLVRRLPDDSLLRLLGSIDLGEKRLRHLEVPQHPQLPVLIDGLLEEFASLVPVTQPVAAEEHLG